MLEVKVRDCYYNQGISALASLKNLEQFLFSGHTRNHGQGAIEKIRVCFRLLPHLQATYYNGTVKLSDMDGYLTTDMERALASMPERTTLKLRQLVLHSIDRLPLELTLPDLEVLHLRLSHLTQRSEAVQLHSDQFPRLVKLYMTDSMLNLANLLGSVGRQLQTLRISIANFTELTQVMSLCPNLKILHVSLSNRSGDQFVWQSNTLQHLKRLVLDCYGFYPKVVNPAGLVTQLLRQAPKLKWLQFRWLVLSDKDMDELTEVLKRNTKWSVSMTAYSSSNACDYDTWEAASPGPSHDSVIEFCLELP